MSEATTIAGMLKTIAEGPAWHGPAVHEVLEGVTAETAARGPANGGNSLWAILNHMSAWQDYAIGVIDGGSNVALEGDDNFPPVPQDTSDEDWETSKRNFFGGTQEIRERVVHLTDEQLREQLPGRDFPLKILLHGTAQHNLYHLGQLAILKKG